MARLRASLTPREWANASSATARNAASSLGSLRKPIATIDTAGPVCACQASSFGFGSSNKARNSSQGGGGASAGAAASGEFVVSLFMVINRAANWQLVGRTTGRGKTSHTHAAQLPAKDVWMYPLLPDFRRLLADQ